MQLFSRPASAARQPAESRSPGAARRIRKTGIVAAAAAVVMALSACGGGSSPQNADGPVELRFSWWGGDKRAQLTQEAIKQFEAENPNIKINFRAPSPTYDDGHQVILRSALRRSAPRMKRSAWVNRHPVAAPTTASQTHGMTEGVARDQVKAMSDAAANVPHAARRD